MKFNKLLITSLLFTCFSCSTPINNSVSNSINSQSTSIIKFKLKAGLIRGAGDVIPVAKTKVKFLSYNYVKLRDEFIAKNNPGPEPQIKNYSLDDSGFEKYKKDSEEWNKKAEAGLRDEQNRLESIIKPVEVLTDLSGEADVELNEGTWFANANYSTSFSTAFWNSIELKVDSKLQKFELSNDNASISNKL